MHERFCLKPFCSSYNVAYILSINVLLVIFVALSSDAIAFEDHRCFYLLYSVSIINFINISYNISNFFYMYGRCNLIFFAWYVEY